MATPSVLTKRDSTLKVKFCTEIQHTVFIWANSYRFITSTKIEKFHAQSYDFQHCTIATSTMMFESKDIEKWKQEAGCMFILILQKFANPLHH